MSTLGYLRSASELVHDLHPDLERFAHYLELLSYNVATLDLQQIKQLSDVEQEHFLGQYTSPAEFVEESLGNAYDYELKALPSIIRNGIDWARIWDTEYRFDCMDLEIQDDNGYNWLIWHAH